jgi:hypothetical protein
VSADSAALSGRDRFWILPRAEALGFSVGPFHGLCSQRTPPLLGYL